MIRFNTTECPSCGGELKYYDKVKRIVRTKGGGKTFLYLRRFRCKKCKKVHRELPDFIFEYKQYDSEIICGVIDGLITPDTYGYEDYPCEMTMKRWIGSRNLHLPL